MDVVEIGDATLYHGDCMDILPTLGKVDAVVTDPPYGIGEDGGDKKRNRGGKVFTVHEKMSWDRTRPQKPVFDAILDISKMQIIWGGNYFADYLPPSMGWLYWDKRIGGDFSDGELAWTSRQNAVRDFSKHSNSGYSHSNMRQHPTQKPVELMKWCLTFIDGNTVLDPFMGSGTTGVACAHEYRFIGIEKERKYFDIACERIEAAYAQGRLAL